MVFCVLYGLMTCCCFLLMSVGIFCRLEYLFVEITSAFQCESVFFSQKRYVCLRIDRINRFQVSIDLHMAEIEE